MASKLVCEFLLTPETIKAIPAEECKRKASNGKTVAVHYKGSLPDGKQFDSSYDRGAPLTFQLGTGSVIKGWDKGIVGMCVGEKRRLVIPPNLAYGNRAIGPIPANSELTFEVELVDIGALRRDEL